MRRTLEVMITLSVLLLPCVASAQGQQSPEDVTAPTQQMSGAALQSLVRARAQFSEWGLEDLEPVDIIVEFLNEEGVQRTELARDDLYRALKAALLGTGAVDLSLDKSSDPEVLPPASIYLNVTLMPLKQTRSTVYGVQLEVQRRTYFLGDDGAVFAAHTGRWSRGGIGISPDGGLRQAAKDMVRDLVDQFTIDYFGANPRGR